MNNIIFQNSYLRNNYHNTGLDMQNKLEMMRIFCVAAESRNFKEAATQLGISPQVVTRAIKELEEQRGEILFYRSTRQIKITADGERLAKQARLAVGSIDALLVKDTKEKRDEMRGTVRLTVSSVLGRKLVVPALAEFATRYPDIVVDCVLTDSHSDVIDERAAKVHADFIGIHPFIDGNGRTSRLLMNLELLKAGYPPCVITVENRLAYYEALDQWMAYGKTEAFIQLVSDAVLEGFKPYQVVLGL
ncbi:LysR family transcriptional regulator [Acinetobacter sp. CIP 102082]|uniref:LysR family transcriptional regulator n=1 Tax=Acinetobacter sp. CIP 102082 TaxID=1144663 RepID=UPI002ADD580A|nr:LysR family transcriptional regulator [Acinetobacter sp. CIP 102082]